MAKKVERFFDIDSGEFVTVSQLYKEYCEAVERGETEAYGFGLYVWNCLTINGGTLRNVEE